MKLLRMLAVLGLAFLPACLWPTGDDVDDSIEEELRSVAGSWSGQTTGANPVEINLQLTESGTAVQGTGTTREQGGAAVPVTVTGTFQRPSLSLTINGMAYQGRTVTASIQGSYSGVVFSAPMQLTATGFAQTLTVILSED